MNYVETEIKGRLLRSLKYSLSHLDNNTDKGPSTHDSKDLLGIKFVYIFILSF